MVVGASVDGHTHSVVAGTVLGPGGSVGAVVTGYVVAGYVVAGYVVGPHVGGHYAGTIIAQSLSPPPFPPL